jgi:hypothetical protein
MQPVTAAEFAFTAKDIVCQIRLSDAREFQTADA